MIPFVTLLFLLLLIAYCVLLWQNRRINYISEELPGPKSFPLIGNGYVFFGKNNEERFSFLINMTRRYSSPCRLWFGPKLVVLIDNPEDLQTVLNSPNCLEKSFIYRFLRCEKGLLTSPAAIWKNHRKLLSPSFSPQILSSYVDIFNEKSSVLVQRIAKNINQGTFDIFEDVSKCTLDTVCATTLGINMNLQSDEGTEYVKAIEEGGKLIIERFYNVWLYVDWIYRKTSIFRLEMKAREKVYSISRRVLEQRKDKKGMFGKSISDYDGIKKPQSYIDQVFRLAENSGEFDEQTINDELDTIIASGNETSALTLSHIILMLAMHENIQQKVYQEIVDIIGSTDPFIPVKVEHLKQLNYTEMVMKETMRLFPVGPIIGRTCTAPTKISKTTIPAGTYIKCVIFNVHRNPKYWGDNVYDFDPDRFNPEHIAERHPYSYLPFSGGPRNCIGYKYALMSIKIMLCHLLRSYRFTSPLKMEQIRLEMTFTMKIANRQMVQIEKRSE